MDCLVLNADGNPVSLLPLSTIVWEEAIRYMVLDKANVLEWHNDWVVRSERWSTAVPAVIMLKDYMKPKSTIRLTKKNVFMRDSWVCQYCSKSLQEKECTLDHVVPSSKGGKTTWENAVTACKDCNYTKGDQQKGWIPKKVPKKPSYFELIERRRQRPFNIRHPSWAQYLGNR
jgi:5-methylcytosine-specific restriction endonuclease McrA